MQRPASRRGSDAQLLHHAQGVKDQPRFGDLAFSYEPDAYRRHVYVPSCGGYSHKLPFVRAASGLATDYLLCGRKHVIQTNLQVGEGVYKRLDERLDDVLYPLVLLLAGPCRGEKSEAKSPSTTSSLR